jgi:putative peptidoglycan lipid II flippase
MTFISRILGFVRDLIAAQLFGVNAAVDAFYIAFKIPNFMRNLFAEGSFSQAFVPVLSHYRQTRSDAEVKLFISHISAALGLILIGVTILGVLGASKLIHIFAPGLEPYRFNLATSMLKITFPYLMLISLTGLIGSILNTYGFFGSPAFTPVLLNLCLIFTAYTLSSHFAIPVTSQAYGVLLAGVVQLSYQLYVLVRKGHFVWPKLNWQDEGVKRVLKLIIPALLGASMTQISILINTILASHLILGSISWLYYSERLAYFPLGVFGVALATVVLPKLSREFAKNSLEGYSKALDWGIRANLLIGMPATVAMLILSGPLMTSLFQYGRFTPQDVMMAQQSVMAYGIGLQAFMLVKVLSSAFYARQEIPFAVKISMISLAVGIVSSFVLIIPFAHAGLALSTSIASWVNAITLWIVLYRRGIFQIQPGFKRFMIQLTLANAMVALFLSFISPPLMTWIHFSWQARLFHILSIGFSAMIIYVGSLWILRIRLREFF